MKHHNYNSKLKPNARKLRREMTKAEACIWKYLLKGKQTGYGFRRQRPIGRYIVDFVCLPLKLIIEIDGESHNHTEIAHNDKVRQEVLESLGYKVVRFTDEEILKELSAVGMILESIIQERIKEIGE